MGTTTKGFIELGSFVRGLNPDFAGSIIIGHGTSTFNKSVYYLDDEFARKEISWSWNGNDPRGEIVFGTTEQNGSYIGEVGIGVNSTVGSDVWNRDTSAIGSKLSSYAVQIQFDWRFRNF